MTRSRLSMLFVALLALALVTSAVACGSKKEEAPPKAATAETKAATPAATAAAKAGGPGGAIAGNVAAALCGNWKNVASTTASGPLSAPPPGAPGAGLDAMKTQFANLDTTLKAMVDQSPAEIRPDMQVIAKYWGDFVAIMAKANYDFIKLAQDPEFEKFASGSASADVEKASKNIDAWVQKNCT